MTDWISVKDRLPDDSGYCLITDGESVSLSCRVNDIWYFIWTVLYKEITHWMPLPEPPEALNE